MPHAFRARNPSRLPSVLGEWATIPGGNVGKETGRLRDCREGLFGRRFSHVVVSDEPEEQIVRQLDPRPLETRSGRSRGLPLSTTLKILLPARMNTSSGTAVSRSGPGSSASDAST